MQVQWQTAGAEHKWVLCLAVRRTDSVPALLWYSVTDATQVYEWDSSNSLSHNKGIVEHTGEAGVATMLHSETLYKPSILQQTAFWYVGDICPKVNILIWGTGQSKCDLANRASAAFCIICWACFPWAEAEHVNILFPQSRSALGLCFSKVMLLYEGTH